jgi:hypothetical protein
MEGNTLNLESVRGKEHKISKIGNNISTAYDDYKEFEGSDLLNNMTAPCAAG